MTLRLALLGALRHWKRSITVTAAVASSCAVMLTVGSFLNGISESFYTGLATGAGHIRVRSAAAASAFDLLGLEALLPDAENLAERIRAIGGKDVLGAEALLSFGALLVEKTEEGESTQGESAQGESAEAAAEARSLAMRGLGLRPDSRFAEGPRQGLREGAFLPGGEGILISAAAARLLRVGLGDGLLLLVQDRNSQPWYEELAVTGIFATESKDFDETTFYLDFDRAGEMLDVAGSARELRLLLGARGKAPSVAARLARELGPDFEVLDWRSINASMLSLLVIIKVALGFMLFLFALVAGTIVTNTVLMSVMERMREFGTMRAIGLKARELRRLIATEGALLGLAGAALGLALGSLALGALSARGIDLGGLMESLGLSRYNRPAPSLAWYAACALFSALIGAIAASRAARTVSSLGVAESLASIR